MPKKGGAWTVCRFKGGLHKKEGQSVFERGWYPNAHYVEGKTGTEIPKLSIIGLLKKVLANNFALSDAEDNTTRSLNKASIADLALLGTLLAMCQKSSEPSFWITSLFELYFKTQIYFVGKNKKKRFLWVMAVAQALKP